VETAHSVDLLNCVAAPNSDSATEINRGHFAAAPPVKWGKRIAKTVAIDG
jgi:hypothetical protein